MRKGQSRLDRFIALYARGMTTRDIRGLREIYEMEVRPDLISRATDAVVEEPEALQSLDSRLEECVQATPPQPSPGASDDDLGAMSVEH